MTEILVGCPVYQREWILPHWFRHVEAACEEAEVSPVYAFVVDGTDTATIDVIADHDGKGYVFNVEQNGRGYADHKWDHDGYRWMVELRNELLQVARLVDLPYFLSLDSDILLHRRAIANLLESSEDADAVGGKTYMTVLGKWCPSYAMFSRSGLSRKDTDGVSRVDVIMAIKLMKPSAYAVDYEFHEQGEDIGWSKACTEKRLVLKFDGRVVSKHVMERNQLDRVDKRVGF